MEKFDLKYFRTFKKKKLREKCIFNILLNDGISHHHHHHHCNRFRFASYFFQLELNWAIFLRQKYAELRGGEESAV